MAEDCGRGSHRNSQSWDSIDKKNALNQQKPLSGSEDPQQKPSLSPCCCMSFWAQSQLSPSTPVGSYILHLPVGQRKGSFFLERSLGKFPSRWSWSIQLLRDFGILGSMQPFLEALTCAPQCFFLPLRVTRVEP